MSKFNLFISFLAPCIIGSFWIDSILRQYSAYYYIVLFNTFLICTVPILISIIKKHGMFAVVIFSSLIGYIGGFIINLFLEWFIVGDFLVRLTNSFNRDFKEALILFLAYPIIFGSWLQSAILAIILWCRLERLKCKPAQSKASPE